MRPKKIKRTLLAAATGVALCAWIGTALAAEVTVYGNNFSTREKYDQIIRTSGGKSCERRYRAKSQAMLASVKRGQSSCGFVAPVESDQALPNHSATVVGKVLKKTPKRVRPGAYLEVSLRAGGAGVGYTLRVFPQKRRFELFRGPEGPDFPATGNSDAINKVNERNELQLSVKGARIQAFANGEALVSVTDTDPGQVTGRKVRFASGTTKQRDEVTASTFKSISVAVPSR